MSDDVVRSIEDEVFGVQVDTKITTDRRQLKVLRGLMGVAISMGETFIKHFEEIESLRRRVANAENELDALKRSSRHVDVTKTHRMRDKEPAVKLARPSSKSAPITASESMNSPWRLWGETLHDQHISESNAYLRELTDSQLRDELSGEMNRGWLYADKWRDWAKDILEHYDKYEDGMCVNSMMDALKNYLQIK